MLYSFENLLFRLFHLHVLEDQNTEGRVYFKIKISEPGYLNTVLFMGDSSQAPTAVSGELGL